MRTKNLSVGYSFKYLLLKNTNKKLGIEPTLEFIDKTINLQQMKNKRSALWDQNTKTKEKMTYKYMGQGIGKNTAEKKYGKMRSKKCKRIVWICVLK